MPLSYHSHSNQSLCMHLIFAMRLERTSVCTEVFSNIDFSNNIEWTYRRKLVYALKSQNMSPLVDVYVLPPPLLSQLFALTAVACYIGQCYHDRNLYEHKFLYIPFLHPSFVVTSQNLVDKIWDSLGTWFLLYHCFHICKFCLCTFSEMAEMHARSCLCLGALNFAFGTEYWYWDVGGCVLGFVDLFLP